MPDRMRYPMGDKISNERWYAQWDNMPGEVRYSVGNKIPGRW